MTRANLALIVLSVFLSASGQVVLKYGASGERIRAAVAAGGWAEAAFAMLTSPAVLLGLIIYGLSAVSWVVVLTKVDLSQAYAFVSLGFVLVFLSGWLVLREPFVPSRLIGTLVIAGGCYLISRA
ncbi:MAG: permease [Novosphingobium sp.]